MKKITLRRHYIRCSQALQTPLASRILVCILKMGLQTWRDLILYPNCSDIRKLSSARIEKRYAEAYHR